MKEETRKELLKVQSREIRAEAARAEGSDLISLAFSSPEPYIRWWGIEILSHKAGAADLARLNNAAPLLVNHDPDDQVGVIESARIDSDQRGRAVSRFSKSGRAQEILTDVEDKIRQKTSVSYRIKKTREIPVDEMDDALKNMAIQEGLQVIEVTRWEPLEVSIVSVPADDTVGVGRQLAINLDVQALRGAADNPITTQSTIHERSDAHMEEKVTKTDPQLSPEELAQVKADAAAEAQTAERERTAEIDAYASRVSGKVPGVQKLADQAKKEGWDVAKFTGAVLSSWESPDPLLAPASEIGLSNKEAKIFSIHKMIRHQLGDRNVDAGFELECSNAVSKNLKRTPQGFFVPYDVQIVRTDLTVGTAAQGGNLVGTNLMAGSFIEQLRAKLLASRLGVTIMSGLTGDVAIPKQASASTAYWVAEQTAITESSPTFGQVTLSPNTLGAFNDYSRQLLLQATPSIDDLVRADLVAVLARAIDKAIFHGAGTDEPTGIENTTSVGTVTAASMGWAEAVEFETDIAAANADELGSMFFVAHPTVVGTLKTRPKETGYPLYLVEGGEMNGYPVERSTGITNAYIFFGNFRQAILAEWGVLDILADPYTASTKGDVRIIAFQSVDVGVRHPGAFTFCTDFT